MFDAIFNSFKIKYALMNDLFNNNGIDNNPKQVVNIYINLDMIYKALFNVPNDKLGLIMNCNVNNLFVPITGIINLAAHYGQYFYKNGMYTRIFLYGTNLSNNDYINRGLIKHYRSNFNSSIERIPYLRKLINESIPFIKTICEYLDDIYFIDNERLEPSVIPKVISDRLDKNDMNLIITKDKYEYQYVNQGFIILRPKKDDSYIITKNNLYDTIVKENNYKVKFPNINTSFYPFLYSTNGDVSRNIMKIRGNSYKTTANAIVKGIEQKIITNDTDNISQLLQILKPDFRNQVYLNYLCTDVNFQSSVSTVEELNIKNQIKNKFDNSSLKEINEKYLSDNGNVLMLFELTDRLRLQKPYYKDYELFK